MANPNKLIVGVDKDEVLKEYIDHLFYFAEEVQGLSVIAEKIDDNIIDLEARYGIERDFTNWLMAEFSQTEAHYQIEPIAGSAEALGRMAARGRVEFVLITDASSATSRGVNRWLDRHYPDVFSDRIFTNRFDPCPDEDPKTKVEYAKELGLGMHIDDSVAHTRDMTEAGLVAVNFGNYRYNQADQLCRHMLKACCWREVEEIIEEHVERI